MHNKTLGQEDVLRLINSPHLTPQTAAVLQQRLGKKGRINPPFFADEDFRLLVAVSNCLYPPEEGMGKVPLAEMMEESVAVGKGKGWRYDNLPPIKILFTQGLHGINEEALIMWQKPFVQASPSEQEQVLQAVQSGNVKASIWQSLSPQLFFKELLVMATEHYYSHPLVKHQIGDVSFADQPGWQQIGLNQWDGREPQ